MFHARAIVFLLCILTIAYTGFADVKLPACFSDHMVIQREAKVAVWGTAEPAEKITIAFGGQQKLVTADADGRWLAQLEAMPASAESRELAITGKNAVVFRDVLVGEVWLASGQSNMDFTVAKTAKYYFAGTKNEAEEVAAANHPRLRMFTADWTMRAEPQRDVVGTWKVCTPENVREFSAVAYFFARELQRQLDVPVGILTCTCGASTAEAWVSREALAAQPELRPKLEKFDTAVAAFAGNDSARAGFERAMQRWQENAAKASAEGRNPPRKPKDPDPVQDQHNPTVLFNGMIAPIIPYTIRGALWYQGESSSADAAIYPRLQGTLVTDWRTRWGLGEFPFYYVQLAANNAAKPEPGNSRLASFREAQRQALATPNTGMIVTIDVGEEKNVHPRNKQDVGLRFAKLALAKTYGRPIEFSGPVLTALSSEGAALRAKFTHVAGGLVAKDGPLQQFAIAGSDRKWVWADARVDGDSVLVSNPKIPTPVALRYAWADFPAGANLYNSEGLPAEPFEAVLPGAEASAKPASTALTDPPAKRTDPTLFLIGDSTVKNGTSGFEGWGKPIANYFDPAKVAIENAALGGRSSRSYLREGLWDKVVAKLQAGDFVIMQFGHNDGGPMDEGKARASIKGNGDETREVTIKETGAKETVLSYGGYLRRYIADTKAKGATPIVCSPIPRNIWKEGKLTRAAADYGKWANEAAQAGGAEFIDLNEIIAARYEALGQEKVRAEFFTAADHTHTTPAGADANAACVVEGIRALKDCPLRDFLAAKSGDH
jgi:sialate O-acetylesterase